MRDGLAEGQGDGRSASEKGPGAFRTISEVAEELDLPQHVLRFWETRFAQIKPLKRGGGRRYYRPDDLDLLKGIRELLYGQGYTIKGVQRILKQDGYRFVQGLGRGEAGAVLPAHHNEPDTDGEPEGGVLDQRPEAHAPSGEREEPLHREAARAEPAGDLRLPPRDLELLQSTLDELLECERVLAALTPSTDPDGDRS
jgi:DNA-binding transcriptional MerR regulator